MAEVSETVKDETARQTVILVFTVVTVLVSIAAMNYQDTTNTSATKMRIALWVKHFAQSRADYWQTVALKAATAYNRERM